jgi:pimeloyl-ACP methyl ester carboxylesterase
MRHDRDSLMHTLPESVYTVIRQHESDRTTDAPEYIKANRIFLEHFHARRLPWSADLDTAIAIYNTKIRLRPNRPPRDWTAHLREFGVPILFTVGRYDYSTPAAAVYYQTFAPGSELVVLEQSAHLTMHDEPDRYNAVLSEFLRKVDALSRSSSR